MIDATTVATQNGIRGRTLFEEGEWLTLAGKLGLSPREQEIVRAIFDDLTEARIGGRLGISSHTVHTYVERLYRKLDVRSRGELMVRVFHTHRGLAGG